MPGFLRQSTASQARALGPFVDDTDFKTVKTGLTVANTDIKLVANGAASANKNSGGGTHRVNGVYGVTFDATDTATVGELEVSVVVASALPVFDKFIVVEEAVYDALFVASAPGYVVDQPVNATKVGGTSQTGRDLGASVLLSSGTGTGQLDFTSGVVKSNLVQILATALTETAGLLAGGFKKWFNVASPTGTLNSIPDAVPDASGGLPVTGNRLTAIPTIATVTNLTNAPGAGDFTATMKTSIGTAVAASAVASVTGNVGGNVTGSVGSVASGGITDASFAAGTGKKVVRANTAAAGAGSTITLDAAASATDSIYNGLLVYLTGGTGAGQTRRIIGYVGSTQVATVDRAWQTNPDNTSTFALLPSDGAKVDSSLQVSVGALASGVLTATAIAADAITAAKIADGAIDAATFAAGAINAAAIAADAITDAKVASDVTIASVTGAVGSVTGAVGSVTGNVGGNVTGSIGSLATQAKADVNAEADTALADAGVTTTVTGRIDAAITTRLASASYTAPPTVGAIADQVWEETLADHSGTSGSTAAALNAAGSAGDPWNTALPGSYGSGTAGKIIGDNINATVGSRMATFTLPTNFSSLVIDGTGRVNAFLIGILTSVFTEGATGRVAAAFKQFFNIATPAATMDHGILTDTTTTLTNAPSDSSGTTTLLTRVPSGIFTGITSLAQWLGLIAGKQTGNSTARTEIRATGAGSGTFDETTDSTEAIRDRGDAAWADSGTPPSAATIAAATAAQVTTDHGSGSYIRNTEPPTAAQNATQVRTELTTELGRLDAAVSTRATPAQVNTEADTAIADAALATAVTLTQVKAKTDKLTFDADNALDANVQKVNDVTLTGDGTISTPWGPA